MRQKISILGSFQTFAAVADPEIVATVLPSGVVHFETAPGTTTKMIKLDITLTVI